MTTEASRPAARGLAWDLPTDYFVALLGQPCYYCGTVRADVLRNGHDPTREFRHNGIDRLNGGDYTTENSVACCWTCNRKKGDTPVEDFIAWCRRIAQQHPA